jgi:FMN-dependent NADH-azoreductase
VPDHSVNLLRVDASVRLDGSVTRAVADSAQSGVQSHLPGVMVTRRELGRDPLPARTWVDAVAARASTAPLTPSQQEAKDLATRLADELVEADVLLFAIPLYNFGVPHHVKSWVDVVITDPRMKSGSERILAHKPAILVLARGGGYGEGAPRHGWDHNTPWLRRIFVDVWDLDLQLIEVELTLAHVTPAMEALRDRADQELAAGHVLARRRGELLAERLLPLHAQPATSGHV